jgi:hypothetical protein
MQPKVTGNSLLDAGRRQIRPAFPGTGTTVVKLAFAGKRRANRKRVRARVTDRQTGERKTTMDRSRAPLWSPSARPTGVPCRHTILSAPFAGRDRSHRRRACACAMRRRQPPPCFPKALGTMGLSDQRRCCRLQFLQAKQLLCVSHHEYPGNIHHPHVQTQEDQRETNFSFLILVLTNTDCCCYKHVYTSSSNSF